MINVSFMSTCKFNGVMGFQFGNEEAFCVKRFDSANGTVVIEPVSTTSITSFSKAVVECVRMFKGANGVKFNGVKAVEFFLIGASAVVENENITPAEVSELWGESMWSKFQRHGKSLQTEDYRNKAKVLVEQAVAEQKMQFKCASAQDTWNTFVKENSASEDGLRMVRYAETWSKYMQFLMEQYPRKFLSKLALKASHDANQEDISGLIYGNAACMLFRVWKWGALLRCWHKDEYGKRGYGVSRPDLLISSVK